MKRSSPKDSVLLHKQKKQCVVAIRPGAIDKSQIVPLLPNWRAALNRDKQIEALPSPKVIVPRPPKPPQSRFQKICENKHVAISQSSSSSSAGSQQAFDKQVIKSSKTVPNSKSIESIVPPSLQCKLGQPAFHIVFIIDTSRSMDRRDVTKGKLAITRISAVADAVEGFSKLLVNYPDILTSVILFNDSATVDLEARPINGEYGLMQWLQEFRSLSPRFGGKYVPALQAFRSLHEGSPEKVTIGVMLSDGRPGDGPGLSQKVVQDMRKKFGEKVIVHTVMFGPEVQNASCLEMVAKAGGGMFHANAELDATTLQSTFMRLSASVSTLRSSVLAFGEKALKRIPEKALEADVAWDDLPAEELLKRRSSVTREVRGEFMLPAKGGSELDLVRSGGEKVAYLHNQPFAQGAMRYASHLWWISNSGEAYHLVVKESKFEGAHETPKAVHGFFLKNHRRAQDFGKDFNSKLKTIKGVATSTKVKFIPAYIAALRDRDSSEVRYLICEKFIPGQYVKYNANDGWVNTAFGAEEIGQVAAAFSHFSFVQCEGRELCVDIQGVGPRWTDPQIHSRTREFGAGDLGEEGMKLFFRSHTCNKFCSMLNLASVDAEDLSISSVAKDRKEMVCLLCLDADRTVVNQPCMHLCLCKDCHASQKKGALCIICRQVVKSTFEAASISEAMHHSTFYKAP